MLSVPVPVSVAVPVLLVGTPLARLGAAHWKITESWASVSGKRHPLREAHRLDTQVSLVSCQWQLLAAGNSASLSLSLFLSIALSCSASSCYSITLCLFLTPSLCVCRAQLVNAHKFSSAQHEVRTEHTHTHTPTPPHPHTHTQISCINTSQPGTNNSVLFS